MNTENNKLQFKAYSRNLMMSPLKLRLVANLIRNKNAQTAIDELKFLNKKGSDMVLKVLESAVANANSLKGIEAKELVVSSISVDEAPSRRGVRFASRSRVARLIKRRSHINLILSEK